MKDVFFTLKNKRELNKYNIHGKKKDPDSLHGFSGLAGLRHER